MKELVRQRALDRAMSLMMLEESKKKSHTYQTRTTHEFPGYTMSCNIQRKTNEGKVEDSFFLLNSALNMTNRQDGQEY